MKKIILYLALLFTSVNHLIGQDIIATENFDNVSVPVLPNGWNTSTNYNIGFRTDVGQASNTYTNASGVNNVLLRNSDSTGTYTLTSPEFSTINYVNVGVLWGARVSNNFLASGSTTPLFEYSIDGGGTWTQTDYVENESNSTWSLVNGGTAILLPVNASNTASLKFRWTINIVNQVDGTYRMDDFQLVGTYSPTVEVTFQVNMSSQIIAASGVFLSASYNGFGLQQMQHVGNGVYVLTVAVDQGTQIGYRFVNGTSVSGPEVVPAACGALLNGVLQRSLSVGAENVLVPAVCFGECGDCALITATVRVNMSLETVATDGVFIKGNFPGVQPAVQSMTEVGGGIWQTNLSLPSNYLFNYQFWNGQTVGLEESVPAACADANGDRTLQTGTVNIVVTTVCFSSCDNCIIITPVYVNITLQVNMSQQTVAPEGVFVEGTFNGFDPSLSPMTDQGNGIYAYTFLGEQGQEYIYRFKNGMTDIGSEIPEGACVYYDENGNAFRTVFAGSSDQTLNVVCFNECSNCIEVVPATVTLSVDMSQETVSGGVYIVGDFQNWVLGSNVMTSSGSGIYTATISVAQGQTIHYRFVNGSNWSGAEVVPVSCGVDDGSGTIVRSFEVVGVSEEVSTVCFQECTVCEVSVEESDMLSVKVWPNPGSEGFYLNDPSRLGDQIMVFNISGQLVWQGIYTREMEYINATELSEGVYFIHLVGTGRSSVQRWIKCGK